MPVDRHEQADSGSQARLADHLPIRSFLQESDDHSGSGIEIHSQMVVLDALRYLPNLAFSPSGAYEDKYEHILIIAD